MEDVEFIAFAVKDPQTNKEVQTLQPEKWYDLVCTALDQTPYVAQIPPLQRQPKMWHDLEVRFYTASGFEIKPRQVVLNRRPDGIMPSVRAKIRAGKIWPAGQVIALVSFPESGSRIRQIKSLKLNVA